MTAKIKESLDNSWPYNYAALFGSVDDDTFSLDRIKDLSADLERESL